MLRSVTFLFIASIAMSVSGAASAEDDYSRTSCFLGLAGTIGARDTWDDFGDSDAKVGKRFEGMHARAGCRTGWASGELHFELLNNFETNIDGQPDRFDGWAITLDGKAYLLQFLQQTEFLPEIMRFKLPSDANRIQPFVSLGFGYLEFDGPDELDGWSFAGRFGAGLDVWITREVALGFELSYVTPASDPIKGLDFYSMSLGVTYTY